MTRVFLQHNRKGLSPPGLPPSKYCAAGEVPNDSAVPRRAQENARQNRKHQQIAQELAAIEWIQPLNCRQMFRIILVINGIAYH